MIPAPTAAKAASTVWSGWTTKPSVASPAAGNTGQEMGATTRHEPLRRKEESTLSLYKRGGVYWSYVYVDGVRHARSTETGNRRLAEQIDQKHKDEVRLKATQFPELNPTMRFAELAAQFLGDGSAKEWHRDRLKLLLPYFAGFSIGKINKAAIRQYRAERHRTKTLTETTVNRDIECLRHLLYWAVDEGILAANPIARIRLERERRKKKPVLSSEEESRLLPAASPHLRDIVIVALDTGMRRGEILNQRWEDVDFARRLLYVTHSKTPEGESREIPLSDRVFTLFSGMRKDSGLIFTFEGKAIFSLKPAGKQPSAERESDTSDSTTCATPSIPDCSNWESREKSAWHFSATPSGTPMKATSMLNFR